MPNLNTFSTLNERVKKSRADYGLEDNSTAFMWLALEAILQLNTDDIEDALTDGPQDGGIDAIHISGRTVNIFTFKYTEKFDNCGKNFPKLDLDAFVLTVQAIFQKTLIKETVNELVWEKANEIWSLFGEGHLSFKFYVCSNKLPPAEDVRKSFENALKPFRFVEFHYLDQEEIVNKLLERKYRRVDGQLTFIDKQYFERVDGGVKGLVATIAATDLVKLVAEAADPKVVEAARTERGELYTHDKFFKETQTNRLIHEAIEAAYPTAATRLSEG